MPQSYKPFSVGRNDVNGPAYRLAPSESGKTLIEEATNARCMLEISHALSRIESNWSNNLVIDN